MAPPPGRSSSEWGQAADFETITFGAVIIKPRYGGSAYTTPKLPSAITRLAALASSPAFSLGNDSVSISAKNEEDPGGKHRAVAIRAGKPVHEVRLGRVKYAVAENSVSNGGHHNVTVQRSYYDANQ